MKIDNTTAILFIFPIIALLLMIITPMAVKTKNIDPGMEPPEFLAAIDQLTLVAMTEDKPNDVLKDFRDVFRHDWTEKKVARQETPAGKPSPMVPHMVSLIVDDGERGFCVINGKKMYAGDKTEQFEIKEIQGNSVTIEWFDGKKETMHVKAY